MTRVQEIEIKNRASVEDLASSARLVLNYLIDRTDNLCQCFPSITTMAGFLKLSISTIKRRLKELLHKGLIAVEHRFRDNNSQTSNFYTVLVAVPTQENADPQQDFPAPEDSAAWEKVITLEDFIAQEDFNLQKEYVTPQPSAAVEWPAAVEVTAAPERLAAQEVAAAPERSAAQEVTAAPERLATQEVTAAVEQSSAQEVTAAVEQSSALEVTAAVEQSSALEVTAAVEQSAALEWPKPTQSHLLKTNVIKSKPKHLLKTAVIESQLQHLPEYHDKQLINRKNADKIKTQTDTQHTQTNLFSQLIATLKAFSFGYSIARKRKINPNQGKANRYNFM